MTEKESPTPMQRAPGRRPVAASRRPPAKALRATRCSAARWLSLVISLWATTAGAAANEQALAEADRLWEARAEQLDDERALAEPAERALSRYLDAIAPEAPLAETVEARWKSLRAAHYLSEFTTASSARGDQVIEEAVGRVETSLEAVRRRNEGEDLSTLSDRQLEAWLESSGIPRVDIAQLHFWSAIVWGARAQRVGLLTIVRQGIARRMFDDAHLASRIEPTIERGGAFRLLSRLHADLPRVPFVSGWVDRDQALPNAEAAFEIAPEDPGNQMILALALRDQEASPRPRIEELLASAARHDPRPELRAEDLAIRREAEERLSEWRQAAD